MKAETFVVWFKDGSKKYVFCKKSEIERFISIAEYRQLDYIQLVNRKGDTVNHRPFKIEI